MLQPHSLRLLPSSRRLHTLQLCRGAAGVGGGNSLPPTLCTKQHPALLSAGARAKMGLLECVCLLAQEQLPYSICLVLFYLVLLKCQS